MVNVCKKLEKMALEGLRYEFPRRNKGNKSLIMQYIKQIKRQRSYILLLNKKGW